MKARKTLPTSSNSWVTMSEAGVYLKLFHGRNAVDEELDDWGFDGPEIGPLEYVHVTYMCDIKFAMSYSVAAKFFPDEAEEHAEWCAVNEIPLDRYKIYHYLGIHEALVVHDGKFYGDWSVYVPEKV